jgi:DNA segregation ATPase FtsK/SpoIIIE, S-DNA-T family
MELKELLNRYEVSPSLTSAILGTSAEGGLIELDITQATHVLIAGSTGSGKSCMMNSIISSLMLKNTKETATFCLIDPKRVEFFDYKDSNMLYGGEVINTTKKALLTLSALCEEMEKRYMLLEWNKKRNYQEFKNRACMKDIYICIDELSFLMLESKKECEEYISKIGMLGRAAGLHLILATQQPTRKIITGTIQANIPTVIGLATRNSIDSRMIIGNNSLTKLKGKGDSILVNGLSETHFQGCYVNQSTIEEIVNDDIQIGDFCYYDIDHQDNRIRLN